ncbi:MAG: hypothetical protein PHD20_02900 [Clostridia bacterium]|nr:hypothetical protein [Clostridia bacterium]
MYNHLTAKLFNDPFGCHAYIWGLKKDAPTYYIEKPYINYTIELAKIHLSEFYPGIQITN